MSTLRLVAVPSLPTFHRDFIDCSEIGCAANGVRLNTDCDERLYLNCYAYRAMLIHDPDHGWTIKPSSREEIASRCQEAREENAPQVGAVWEQLRKMRKAA
jgi:hypothetical protein